MDHWLFLAAAGAALFAMYRWRRADPPEHRLLNAAVGALIAWAVVAWFLARLGACTLPAIAALSFAAAGVAAWRVPPGPPLPRTGWGVTAAVVLVALFALYESFPTWYLVGGRDPGVYSALAAHIARTGGVDVDSEAIRTLWERTHAIDPSYPGFYQAPGLGADAPRGELAPQFVLMFPALGSLWWSAFGVGGFVRLNALVMTLGLWSLYAVLRRALSPGWALAAIALLGINPAVLWAARQVMTEPTSMLFAWVGLHLLLSGDERRHQGFAAAGGAVLGLAVLDRIDASLDVLLVLGYAAASLGAPEARRRALVAALAYALASVAAFADAAAFHTTYLVQLHANGSVAPLLVLWAAGTLAAVALAALPDALAGRLDRATTPLAVAAVVGLGAWLCWDWAVRSLDVTSFERRSVRELAWYTSRAALPLGTVGMLAAVVDRSRRALWWPLAVLGVFSVFVYTWNPAITPDHPWASRRWVPHVIPLLVVFGTVAAWELARRAPRRLRAWAYVAAVLAGAAYASNAWERSAPFRFRSMLAGVDADLAHVAELVRATRKRKVVLTDDLQLASSLTYIYGVPTVLLPGRLDADAAERLAGHTYLHSGCAALPGSECGAPPRGDPYVVPYARAWFGGTFVVREMGRPVTRVRPWGHPILVGEISPDAGALVPQRFGAGAGLSTHVGTAARGGYATSGQRGFLAYGPYVALGAGTWLAQWQIVVRAPGTARLDVTVAGETLVASELPLTPSDGAVTLQSLTFSLLEPTSGVELRTWVDDGLDATLLSVTLLPLTTQSTP